MRMRLGSSTLAFIPMHMMTSCTGALAAQVVEVVGGDDLDAHRLAMSMSVVSICSSVRPLSVVMPCSWISM